MKEFFDAYKTTILNGAIVIAVVIGLRLITNYVYTILIRRIKLKHPGIPSRALELSKRILNAIWLVLGFMIIAYLLFDNNDITKLQHNFKLVIYLGIVTLITIVSASSVNLWFKHTIVKKTNLKEDPTSFKFLRYVAVSLVYLVGLLIGLLAFPQLKGVAQTALGGGAVIALIAGVAAQEALANVVGGVFIIMFKPFRVGDVVKISDQMVGTVSDITLRHTLIRNYENKMIVIPNAIINKEKLINYNLGELKVCDRLEIGISYTSDITLAKKIMQEECENHPLILDNRSLHDKKIKKPVVRTSLISLNSYDVTIRAWVWAKDNSTAFDIRCDVLESIKNRFDAEGIEIPYPYQNIVLKKENLDNKAEDETL